MTSASLFASRMRLPALAAAIVERRPAAPTIAATTVSRRAPARGFDEPGLAGQHARRQTRAGERAFEARAPRPDPTSTAMSGRCRRQSCASFSHWLCAVSAATAKRSGCPRNDVERRIADRAGRAENADAPRTHRRNASASSAAAGMAASSASIRSSMPPCPGRRASAVLHARLALQQRFAEIAHDRERRERERARDPDDHRERRHRTREAAVGRQRDERQRIDCDGREAAVDAFPRLARAHVRRELAPAERAAREIRRRIRDPDDRHRRQHEPRRARLQLHDRHPRADQHDPARHRQRQRGGRLPPVGEPRHRRQQPEERREPADGEHDAARPPGGETGERREQQIAADQQRADDEDPPGLPAKAGQIRPFGRRDDDRGERRDTPAERRQQEHGREHQRNQHRRGQDARREHRGNADGACRAAAWRPASGREGRSSTRPAPPAPARSSGRSDARACRTSRSRR